MNTSPENSPQEHKNVGDSTETDPNAPVTREEWERLRAPFSRSAYMIKPRASGRTETALPVEGSNQNKSSYTNAPKRAVADLWVRAQAIRDRLDLVLGPHRYSYRLEPVPGESAEQSVFCHLHIGTASRTGVGNEPGHRSAQKYALADAALAFGIGATSQSTGPIVVGQDNYYEVPLSILEALETQDPPSFWTPETFS